MNVTENRSADHLGFHNPEWEKAQQALKKLQAEKGGKKSEDKNAESSFTSSPESPFYSHGPNRMYPMFGRFPPPNNYGFGSMYPPGPFPPRPRGFNPYGPPNIPPPIHDRPPFPKYDQDVGNGNCESQESNNHNGSMQGAPPRFGNKQAPGVSPVRFNLPKRNQIRPSTPMQSHSNNSQSVPKFRSGGLRPPRPQVPSFHPPTSVAQPKENLPMGSHQTTSGDGGYQTSQEKGQEAAAKEWSPSLKAYVQRCFASVDHQNMDKVEALLREKITAAFHNGTANTIDWSNELIVQLPGADQRPVIPSPQLKMGGSKWGNQNSVFAFGQGTNRGRQRGNFRGQAWSTGVRRPRSRSGSRSSDSRSRSRSRSPYRSPRHSRHRRRNSSSTSSDSLFTSDEEGRHSSDSPDYSHRKLGRNDRFRGRGEDRGRRGARGSDNKGQQRNKNKNKKNKKKGFIAMDFVDSPIRTAKMQQRAQRFGNVAKSQKRQEPLSLQINQILDNGDDDLDWSKMHINGTCCNLEKEYLRLTTAPDPSTVRPEHILKKSLEMVKQKWKANGNYRYAWEQMKSIRQDITVQNIRNDFVIKVYESHARIALEKGDHEEFNQCQTQLLSLYLEGHKGNCYEFTAYRILYFIFTSSTLDIVTIKSSLTAEMKNDECIKHATYLQEAFAMKNFTRFFKLHANAPKMSGYLIDWFVERVRKDGLKLMVKSYRPTLPVCFVTKQLGFGAEADVGKWLTEKNIPLTADGTKIDCKAAMSALASL